MKIIPKGWAKLKSFSVLLTFCLLLVACSQAPISGRNQLILISEYQEIQLGLTAYNQVLDKEKLSSNEKYVNLVKKVGNRIAPHTEKNYNWQFNVIESPLINAWCLPGGKIAFYEGILDIMENEAQIAAVMGHEIAHATARHGGERISLGIKHLKNDPVQAFIESNPVKSKVTGKIVDIDFHYSYYLPWHLWPFLEEIDRVEIPYNSIHLFDLIRSLFGMPEGVFAYSNTHPKYPNLSDTKTTAILKYRKDLRCALSLNHCYQFGDKNQNANLKVEGTDGVAFITLGSTVNYPQIGRAHV